MEHRLKTWPHFFEMVQCGRKRFEVRKNDRNFQAGDKLILQEYDPHSNRYSGRETERHIADVFDLEPLHEAVVLTFVWHGDSTERELRAALAAAISRIDALEDGMNPQDVMMIDSRLRAKGGE